MIGFALRLAGVAAIGVLGWVAGSVYPAPEALIAKLNPQALEQRAASALGDFSWQRVQAMLSPAQADALSANAVTEAVAAGQAIQVEQVDAAAVAAEAPEGSASVLQASRGTFETTLALCPQMSVSNAPRADAQRMVIDFKPLVRINAVVIASNPTRGACLSSGFGPRNGRTHKGMDYHSSAGGPIMAGGDGVVIEMRYRDDYGNMLLIDHGGGVYTRYAHLSSFQRGLAAGARVRAGDVIGLMGNTASYSVPIHLHYEVLLGDYANPRASFGLTPHSPFEFPAAA